MSDVAVDGPLAKTPQPPYVAVIFTSMFTGADVEGYAAMGERMMELVRSQPGYLGVESVHDETGCGITVSYWTDLAAVANWKQHIEHLQAQQAGRSRWYSDYRLRVCEVSRATDLHGGGKSGESEPPHFAALVESRKGWIEDRLRPWCQRALRSDLLLAENEWVDIAGKADPEKTLWAWAWNRFPDLVHADLGIDETSEVVVVLTDGREVRGYPDARRSRQGRLTLLGEVEPGQRGDFGPYSIDEVRSVRRASL